MIACDQIMAINGSSAMDQTACKLVPVPAQKLPEFNLSPQVRGRKGAACVSRPVCIGCIICTRAGFERNFSSARWNLLLNGRVRTRMPKQIFRPADRIWMRRNFQQVFDESRATAWIFAIPGAEMRTVLASRGETKNGTKFHLRGE